jgi:hypothetical protein
MKILFSGDSFTWGDELENRDERYSRLVCDHFGAEEMNISKCGNSNDRILHDIFLPGRHADVIVTQWSVPNRFDTTFDGGKTFRSIMVQDASDSIYNFSKNRSDVQNLARSYYKDVQNDCMDTIRMWRNIMMVKIYCEAKKMTHVNMGLQVYEVHPEPNVFQQMAEEPLKYIVPDIIGEMRDSNNFCPDLTHIDPRKHGNHPNANGHRLIANYVIEQINAKME